MRDEIRTVSQWVRSQRVARGWTQRQLAAATGTTPASVCQIEKRQRQIPFVKICGFLSVLNTTDEQILELVQIGKQEFNRGKTGE